MMSGPHTLVSHHTLRLRLKPKAPQTGYLDGGWWPRSRDLATELPALAEVLAVRFGHVTRVAFAMTGWDTAPRRITVDGRTIRLDGFRSQDEHVLNVSGPDRQRISLLVVPPEMTDQAAHDAMMLAAQRDNADRPGKILAAANVVPAAPIPAQRQHGDDGVSRWEADGGRDYERG